MLSPTLSMQYTFSTISKLMPPDPFQGSRSRPTCDSSSPISASVALLRVSLSLPATPPPPEPPRMELPGLAPVPLPPGGAVLLVLFLSTGAAVAVALWVWDLVWASRVSELLSIRKVAAVSAPAGSGGCVKLRRAGSDALSLTGGSARRG